MTKPSKNRLPEAIVFTSERDMPHFTISMATTEWNETGTWRYLQPRYVERVPACQNACPTANDIESWIRHLEAGRVAEAFEAATIENPFPAIMGRVCFHPCMEGCNRRELGGAVNINALERSLGDAAGGTLPVPKPFFPPSKKKVAVVGSGPAGLACAYHLCRLGHAVTIFERAPKAGGMLRYGIPSYRLPREVLDREVERLKAMGIDFQLEKPVPSATELQVLAQDYSAVFLATGAHKSKPLGIEGEKTPGVMPGLELLKQAAAGKNPKVGRRTVVVGGGNTAVDAARTARRLGAEVTIVYRRSRAEMPAFEEEVRAAEEEGIRFEMLLSPQRVEVTSGRASGLTCQRMKLGDPDASGRRQPIPAEGAPVTIPAETILTAIGEEIDLSIIPSALHIEKGGSLRTGAAGRTEWRNLFAGGDFVAGARTVVDAMAAGKRSAIAIDCLLRGESVEELLPKISIAGEGPASMARYVAHRGGQHPCGVPASSAVRQERVVRYEDLNHAFFTRSEPAATPAIPVEERLGSNAFAEVHAALPDAGRASELARCFHCGRCTECDNCYIYCPDVAIAKLDPTPGFAIDLHYCKGCGVCMHECPRSAMEMIEEPTEF